MNTPLLFLGPGAELSARDEAARLLDLAGPGAEHPDLLCLVPRGTGTIGIEAVREALAWARYAPLEAAKKVILIGPAERLSHEAASALLKSLEEAPPYLVYILHAAVPDLILPTVRSRCRTIWAGEQRSYWDGKLAAQGYTPEEREYLLAFLELDPRALEGFLGERRFPLEEAEEAEAEHAELPPGELVARFVAYAGDPIRRRAAARAFLQRLPDTPTAELLSAAERLARGGREAVLRFLAEYLRFLYSEARDGWGGLSPEARLRLLRKLSLSKAEVEANVNLRLLLEVLFLWVKWS